MAALAFKNEDNKHADLAPVKLVTAESSIEVAQEEESLSALLSFCIFSFGLLFGFASFVLFNSYVAII